MRAAATVLLVVAASVGVSGRSAAPATRPGAHVRVEWTARDLVERPRIPPSFGANVAVGGGRVLLGGDRRGRVAALEARTGRVAWSVHVTHDAQVLLQGATRRTVVVSSGDRVTGLDARTGRPQWELALADLGFAGYRTVRSAVTDDLSAIGISPGGEGLWPPPAVLGVATDDGRHRWTTTLADDTELMLGEPAADDGEVVFVSTASAPGRGENVAHLLDLATGTIRWEARLGGLQGFSLSPAIVDGDSVHLPAVRTEASGRATSVARADGALRWGVDGRLLAVAGDELWAVDPAGDLTVLDPATGAVTREVPAPFRRTGGWGPPLVDVDGSVGVVDGERFALISRDGEVLARRRWRAALVDRVIVTRELVVATSADDVTTAYSVRRS